MHVRGFVVVVVVVVALAACAASALEPVDDFGDNPGNLEMFEHVPVGVDGPLPLVLALHGCSQDEVWSDDIGLTAAADEFGFVVVAARQKSINNGQLCFNWFEEDDITAGDGEQQSLLSMIDSAKARHDVDDARVFVTGLSSGGAMTAVMLATAPDVFAAGASFSGIAYRCGVGVFAAFDCQSAPPNRSQAEWRDEVLDNVESAGPFPPLLVVQGDDDNTVNVDNAEALALQWTGIFGISSAPTSTTTDGDRTTRVFGDAVTTITIAGMSHGIPVDPPSCGSSGAFAPDVDFCGIGAALDFFGVTATAPVGEGEGEDVGEGEGEDVGEGEGEGDPPPGEGEGEGAVVQPESCTCAGSSTSPLLAGLALLALAKRRRRRC